MDIEIYCSPFLWVLHYGTDLIAATVEDDVTELKDIVDKHFGHSANWACDHPWDAEAKFNQRTVLNEDQIVRLFADGLLSRAELIDDWVVCNWAFRTDLPPGEYVTRNNEGPRHAIREAYIAATTGDTVSRAYNVQMILEQALNEQDDSDE